MPVHPSPHPLVEHRLNQLRDRTCPPQHFRAHLRDIALLLTYELMATLPPALTWATIPIDTPVTAIPKARFLSGQPPVIVPVLRAGLVMAEAVQTLLPTADIGHIGLQRTSPGAPPTEYFVKLPDLTNRLVILVDPMIATAHTAIHAIELLLNAGADLHNLRMMALLASHTGIGVLSEAFPALQIHTAGIDGEGQPGSGLNEKCYIVPGLGDAGDRAFGTAPAPADRALAGW
jgi:uracil phosphoribosyltransferase